MNLIPLPAFHDNYLWLLHDGQRALVVDPGDAQPVRQFLDRTGLQLEAILVTHHHPDHIGGADALRDATGARVRGPARERIPEASLPGGGGKLFEGAPAQMLQPLRKLAMLPDDTRVCCTHEYTPANLKFATAVEPGNAQLSHYRQQCEALHLRGEPTLPSSMAMEKAMNPFLRTQMAEMARSAREHGAPDAADQVAVFAAIRQWKNEFR